MLDKEDCPVWVDYQSAILQNTCHAYTAYVEKYQNRGICLDKFYKILAQRGCPSSIDTVTNVVRDTIYEEIEVPAETPPGYNYTTKSGKGKDCQDVFGEPTIRLGPLFMMTNDLDDGVPYDWVGALAACRRLGPGWRLPCAGEIDFILNKHYSNNKSAYDNLTRGSCPLFPVTKATLSGSFWTATEANDKEAWSIHFNTEDKRIQMILNTAKNETMPCRCVYRDPTIPSTIPDCLEKEVYRPRN